MPFDPLLFNGGLKEAGVPTSKCGGQHFTIRKYSDLDHLLGKGWHFRGLNENGDYCYVILSTIDYSLQKLRPFVEFIPVRQEDNKFASSVTNSGHHLVLNFVMNYSSPSTM